MVNLAQRAQKINPSSTLAITARAKKMRQDGFDIVNLAAGEPDFDTPEPIKQAAILNIERGFTKYTPSSGIPELRKAIQDKFRRDNNLEYDIDQIIVSCGAKQCLFNVIQILIDKADEVIIPSPYWVSYVEMVKFAQGEPVIVRTEKANSFKLDPGLLKKNISRKTKALILNSPSNPAGYVYSKEELEDIRDVVVRNNVFVISDEIYEKLIYDGKRHVSIAGLGKEIYDLTFVINGVSKAYSMTGWRIGYLAGNKDIIDAVGRLQDHSTSNPCSISQKAALAALSLSRRMELTSDKDSAAEFTPLEKVIDREDSLTGFIDGMRLEFEVRRNYMLASLDKIKLEYIRPQGAFYVFCDISKTGLNSWDFSKKFLEEKYVASIPGAAFGNDGYVRFSFATSKEQIEKGMQRLEEFLIS